MLSRERRVLCADTLEWLFKSLRPGERLLLYALSTLLALSVLLLIANINREATTSVPSRGGSVVEGLIGPVRFINPILAVSQTDNDVAGLVFSGLTRSLPQGEVTPDLATSYEISEDGKTYTFTLRDDVTFHDGKPVTAADVVFTIQMAQQGDIKSPRRADWEGVSVTSPDEKTVVFKLPNAYAPFLENTTLGILPKHIWQDTPPEEFSFSPLNTHPVGSGPFYLKKTEADRTGAITKLQLSSFSDYALGAPHLRKIIFNLYPNEDALLGAYRSGAIEAFVGVTPAKVTVDDSDSVLLRATLPRIFGVFFNQNHAPVLADPAVRLALEQAVDTRTLIYDVLGGYGTTLSNPIPPGILPDSAPPTETTPEEVTDAWIETAQATLTKGGWSLDETSGVWKKKKVALAFSLATADAPELVKTAEVVAERWRRIGADVSVHVYPLSELNNTVIRPRAYDALLFGEVIGKALDLFAFWHSSQRNDPGLNLALYTNTRADAILAEARATVEREDREELYRSFAAIVEKDRPAVFLYAPQFIYVTPKRLRGVALGVVTTPSERFAQVHTWYIDTERVWNIFTQSE